ncbi:MAG: indolepyruvate oxidoreductase subunit beta [Acidobacteriota bacterium]
MPEKRLQKDPYNIIITGVGGQGNVMASRVLSGMLMRRGYRITIGETFGMSQRGGAVMSHIRVSEQARWSPQVPRGRADMVLGLEPVETIRVLRTYGNSAVKVLTNTRPIYPVGVITGELSYPSLREIRKTAQRFSAGAWFLDATEEAVKLGNPILANIVMVGALVGLGELPVDREDFAAAIGSTLPPDKMPSNLQAFDVGVRKLACTG